MSEYLKALQEFCLSSTEIVIQKSQQIKKFVPKADPILLKFYPDTHILSVEEQGFFIKLTEGAFGFNEHIRNESLQILSQDYHVQFLAPHLCVFIREAIQVNIVFPDLSLLIYAVRMTKSLMSNPNVDLKKYLHILLPAILSCVLSKRISKYNYDNHWTLRDFSAQVVATMCYNHSDKFNDIKKRVIKIYMKAIQDARRPLTTLYGGLKGISSISEEAIRICVLPFIPVLSRRICAVLEKNVYLGESNVEVKHVKKISELILHISGPVLLKHKNVNDGGISYVQEFGYLGYSLYTHVKNLESVEIDKKNNFNVYLFCNH